LIAACFTALDATVLNLLAPGIASFGKMLYVCAAFFILHTILYQSGFVFGLYMTIIYYATMCCIDNLCTTFVFLMSSTSTTIDVSNNILLPVFVYSVEIVVFYWHNRI